MAGIGAGVLSVIGLVSTSAQQASFAVPRAVVAAVMVADLLVCLAGPMAASQSQADHVVLYMAFAMALYPVNSFALRREAAALANGLVWVSSLVSALIVLGGQVGLGRTHASDSLVIAVMASSTCMLAGSLQAARMAQASISRATPDADAHFEAQGKLAAENLRLRQKLARINRISAVVTLTSAAYHELSQPLAASLLSAEAGRRWLGGGVPDLSEATMAIEDAIAQLRRAHDMVSGVRRMAGGHPGALREVSAGEVVDAALRLMGPQLAAAGVRLRQSSSPLARRCRIMVRGEELGQVLINLLGNALESFDHKCLEKEICLSATIESAGWVRLAVSDNGCGIDEHALTQAFDVFYTTKPNGLGLGLAICRDIAESHGGRLEISGCPGEGTRVALHLPIHELEAPAGYSGDSAAAISALTAL